MPTLLSDIKRWLGEAKDEGARWMVVKCDGFDYHGNAGDKCCYPVQANTPEEVYKALNNGDRTMEVYDLEMSIDKQLGERFARHEPPRPT
jgi:hypothetical protein